MILTHVVASAAMPIRINLIKRHNIININERVDAIGQNKSRELLGLHHFTGDDGGGGGQVHWHREKTWIDNYLSLGENDPIVQVFIQLTENL